MESRVSLKYFVTGCGLVYNPKKQDDSRKISLSFDIIQHLRRAYKIRKSLCQYITKHKITINLYEYTVGIKMIKTSTIYKGLVLWMLSDHH